MWSRQSVARSPILGKRGELRGLPKATELIETYGSERTGVFDRIGTVAAPSLSAIPFVRLAQPVEFEGMKR